MFAFAISYLATPVFLVLFTFFSLPYVLLSAVALTVLVFCWCRSIPAQSSFSMPSIETTALMLLVAMVVTYLCVVSPPNVWDWEKNFALFNSLIASSWPPTVKLSEESWVLRYYLAWYAVPALLAKIFGSQLLTVFTVIWTAAGVFIALLLAFKNLHKVSHLLIAMTVFFLFSGWDIVGAYLNGSIPYFAPHWPQIWVGWGEIWPTLTGLAWTPQHVIGGWIAASMFLSNRILAVKHSAVVIAMTALWSPFCAIGLIPLAVYAILKAGYRTAITFPNLLAAPLVAISVGLYLSQGAGQIPFTFVQQHASFTVLSFILFCVFEFLLALAILYLLKGAEKDLLIVLGVFLTSLCLLRFGVLNDLLMRGTIPAIFIIAVLTAKALLQNGKLGREVIIAYLCIGAFPVVFALAKGHSASVPRVDEQMNFNKLTSIYTYEKHPYMTYSYLVRKENVHKIFGMPLLRGTAQ